MPNFIKIPKGGRIIVCGDIHEHEEQFDKLLFEVSLSSKMILVCVGDIYDKGFGVGVAESITDKIKNLVKQKKGYTILGNHELKKIRFAKKKKKMTKQLEWLSKQPLSLSFEFYNRTVLTVVHGGVMPSHTWDDLNSNIEICYIRKLDDNNKMIRMIREIVGDMLYWKDEKPGGRLWHSVYDGRFGYIVSGHSPQEDGVPKFYNYSCNLDTGIYHTGRLSAQIFGAKGKKELLFFDGKAKYPDLDVMRRLMKDGLA